jgi:PAS domain S-box-containing protein
MPAVDVTGRIVFWDRFAEVLYGWTLEEVQGRTVTGRLTMQQIRAAAALERTQDDDRHDRTQNRDQNAEPWSR